MENNLFQADYLRHEYIYAENPTASGWNEASVDEEILSYMDELLHHAQARAPARILEVGCGMGNLSIPLSRAGFCVTGIDISRTAIERAKQRTIVDRVHVSFRIGDVTLAETYRDIEEPDCILDGLCWHCIIGQDRRAFLRCVRNTLKPQGRFLAMTMCGNPRSARLQAHFDLGTRFLTTGHIAERYLGLPQDLEAELSEAGLEVIYHRLIAGDNLTGDQDMFLAVARVP